MIIGLTRSPSPRLGDRVFIAHDALVVGDVTLGDDASLWHGVVARGDIHWIRIGERSNLQDGVVVHVESGLCPTEIGKDVSVGHGAILHGCRIGDGSLIGMGAQILNDAVIGAGAVVAAGAVVREGFEVPPGTLVAGVPATIKRPLSSEEAERAARTARNYLRYKSRALAEQGNQMYHRRSGEGSPL